MGGRPGCRFGPEPGGDPRHGGDRARLREPVAGREDSELSRRVLPHHPGLPAVAPAVTRSLARGDRKSTRLNSSHLVISYAVFCLKKKKKKKIIQYAARETRNIL